MFQIKTYKIGYEKLQFELGYAISKIWAYYYQSPIDILLKKYNSMNFDPTTRLYYFKNEKLIGFITAEIKNGLVADITPPITFDPNVAIVLLEKIIEILKSKNIIKLSCTIGAQWGDSKELIEKFNFKPNENLLSIAIIDNLKIFAMYNFQDYNIREYKSKDILEVSHILSSVIGYSYNRAIEILNTQNPLKTYITLVLEYKGKIIGWIRAHISKKMIIASAGYIQNLTHDKVRVLLLATIVKKMTEENFHKLTLNFTRTKISQTKFLSTIVVSKHEITIYGKIINNN